jgi:hypothetical protein
MKGVWYMTIPMILTALLVCFLVVQIFLLIKTFLLIRQTNWLLHDLKFLLAKNYNTSPSKKPQSKICRNCTFRMSYIHISDEGTEDAFYYKCKLHQREIKLRESCPDFKRYTASSRP